VRARARKGAVTPPPVPAPKKQEGPGWWCGPVRSFAEQRGDWTIYAVGERGHSGAPTGRYDVYARHKSGTRVPAGPAWRTEVREETARLAAILAWGKDEAQSPGAADPWGGSWALSDNGYWSEERMFSKGSRDCSGAIPNTFVMCGEGGNYCSSACETHGC
jgi:hypothetical protein